MAAWNCRWPPCPLGQPCGDQHLLHGHGKGRAQGIRLSLSGRFFPARKRHCPRRWPRGTAAGLLARLGNRAEISTFSMATGKAVPKAFVSLLAEDFSLLESGIAQEDGRVELPLASLPAWATVRRSAPSPWPRERPCPRHSSLS